MNKPSPVTPEQVSDLRTEVRYIGALDAASMARTQGWYRVTATDDGLEYRGPFETEREAVMALWTAP